MSDAPTTRTAARRHRERRLRQRSGRALRLAAIFRRRWRCRSRGAPQRERLAVRDASPTASAARKGPPRHARRPDRRWPDHEQPGLQSPAPFPQVHPDRTGCGARPACARVDAIICRLDLRPIAARRWSMPALLPSAAGRPVHAGCRPPRRRVPTARYRWRSRTWPLRDVVERRVEDAFPPATVYRASRGGPPAHSGVRRPVSIPDSAPVAHRPPRRRGP